MTAHWDSTGDPGGHGSGRMTEKGVRARLVPGSGARPGPALAVRFAGQGATWTPLSTRGNQLFNRCRKVKPWSVRKQRTYPPALSIAKAFSLLALLLVSLWVMNRIFYFIFCVL